MHKEELHDKILAALATVEDPDLKKDLVSLNMIRDLSINEGDVKFTLVLTTFACPLKELIKLNCINAIHLLVGAQWNVIIEIDAQVTNHIKRSIDLPNVKNIIAIASGKGGVGKSTVATNIATSLAKQGAKVGLLDADIFGPSIPIMFGCDGKKPFIEKIGEKNYIVPILCHQVKIMSIGLLTPQEDAAVVWRGPMASKALRQMITDTLWGDLDYLFVDLPPGTSDIHITLAQCVPLSGAVIVTTPQRISTADALKAIDMFTKQIINVPILGIVENMSYYLIHEKNIDRKVFHFGKNGGRDIAKKFDFPFLGELPIDENICNSCDEGVPIVMNEESISAKFFQIISQSLAQQISIENLKSSN